MKTGDAKQFVFRKDECESNLQLPPFSVCRKYKPECIFCAVILSSDWINLLSLSTGLLFQTKWVSHGKQSNQFVFLAAPYLLIYSGILHTLTSIGDTWFNVLSTGDCLDSTSVRNDEPSRAKQSKHWLLLTPATPCKKISPQGRNQLNQADLAFHNNSGGGLSVFNFWDITNVFGCFPSSTNCVRNAYLHDVTWTCHTSWVGIVEDTNEALKQSTITNCLTNKSILHN